MYVGKYASPNECLGGEIPILHLSNKIDANFPSW